MTVRKLDDGKPKLWLVEIYPQGRNGPRKRKRFATKGEAPPWQQPEAVDDVVVGESDRP